MVRKRKRKEKDKKKCFWVFCKRAAIMLFILCLAAGLLSVVGWEAISATGIVKEAFTALADAAADAFGGDA